MKSDFILAPIVSVVFALMCCHLHAIFTNGVILVKDLILLSMVFSAVFLVMLSIRDKNTVDISLEKVIKRQKQLIMRDLKKNAKTLDTIIKVKFLRKFDAVNDLDVSYVVNQLDPTIITMALCSTLAPYFNYLEKYLKAISSFNSTEAEFYMFLKPPLQFSEHVDYEKLVNQLYDLISEEVDEYFNNISKMRDEK